MNSLDDFARLRPDDGPVTSNELDALWPFDDKPDSATPLPAGDHDRSRVRRLALVGAAASLLVGVVAIAVVSDRAEAPPAVGSPTTEAPEPSPSASRTSALPTTTPTTAPSNEASVDAGDPPRWGITEDGWTLTDYEDGSLESVDSVRLFAGPGGLSASWVAIVSGMSPPLLPIEAQSQGSVLGDSMISTQRIADDDGSLAVIAGGVSDAQARSVLDAVRAGGPPPHGFTETDSASAAVRRVQYRFTNDSGETVEVDVQGAGSPRYDLELSAATAVEPWDATAGVDESSIAYAGEYSLLVRNGFWVSRITTSASTNASDDFARLARLVQLVSKDEHSSSLPVASSGVDRLAIGASVMLGPARELVDNGFVVDAVESRTFAEGLDRVRQLAEENRLPDTIVIDLAANSSIEETEMSELLDLLADLEQIVFLTTRAAFDANESNNELIRSLPNRQANVEVLDWAVLGDACPGDCFAQDGLHLNDDGRRYYVALIVDSLA